MILYCSPLSPFSARVKVSLRYKALAYATVKPSSIGGMTSEAFRAVAPLGKIPVLQLEDGTRIAESDAIVEFLEDVSVDRSLRPVDPLLCARARQIARIAELYLINRILWGGPETKTPLGAMMPISGGKAPLPPDRNAVAAEAAALLHALRNIERLMETNTAYGLGDAPSTADGALIPYLAFAQYAADHLDIPSLHEQSLLHDYAPRVAGTEPALGFVQTEIAKAMAARREEVIEKFGPLPTYA